MCLTFQVQFSPHVICHSTDRKGLDVNITDLVGIGRLARGLDSADKKRKEESIRGRLRMRFAGKGPFQVTRVLAMALVREKCGESRHESGQSRRIHARWRGWKERSRN